MAKKLLDKVKRQEAQENQAADENKIGAPRAKKNRALHNISSKGSSKDKQISAKVNSGMYAMFSQINEAQGLSNNSALNMIISKYVRENKGILEGD